MTASRFALASFLADCLDLIYPRQCILTGKPLGETDLHYLSKEATAQIDYIQEPFCHTCGAPFLGELVGPRSCPACNELNPEFQSGRSIWFLRQTTRKLIHEIKYHQASYLLKDLEALIRRAHWIAPYIENTQLIPVPLHPRKQRERGFNQALLIAQRIAKINPTCIVAPILQRTEDTPSQTRLDRNSRWRNVKNAFALTPKASVHHSINYIVVDDVFTTGATLNACCKTLVKHGAKNLRVLTLAHG